MCVGKARDDAKACYINTQTADSCIERTVYTGTRSPKKPSLEVEVHGFMRRPAQLAGPARH